MKVRSSTRATSAGSDRQLLGGPAGEHQLEHLVVFGLRPVTPMDGVGLRQRSDFFDPVEEFLILGGSISGHRTF